MKSDVAKFVRFCDSPLGREILRKEATYIYNELNGSETVLDVGCGLGDFYRWLNTKHNNINYTGIDITTSMIDIAKSGFNTMLIRQTIKLLQNSIHNLLAHS